MFAFLIHGFPVLCRSRKLKLRTTTLIFAICMIENNEHRSSRIGAYVVTQSESEFLTELFCWLLEPAHFPEQLTVKGRSRTTKRLRVYDSLLARTMELMELYPEDKSLLKSICAGLQLKLREIRESRGVVTFGAKDGSNSWYVKKGPRPAVAPRFFLAVCVAKALWPSKLAYDVVVEQLKSKHHYVEKSAVERLVKRLLAEPNKHLFYGSNSEDTDLIALLRHEVLDFKVWREDQQPSTADMSIEEFDRQFPAYLERIHPTAAQLELLRRLVNNFRTRKERERLASQLQQTDLG